MHDQFTASWAHPTAKGRPEVRMVYRIISAQSVWDNYWAYRYVYRTKNSLSIHFSHLFLFFVEVCWKREGNSLPKGNTQATSACCGTERFELAVSGNPARTYSVQAQIVPSAQSLGDRSTWLPLRRALFNDTDQEFILPPSRQSERGVPLCPENPLLKDL